MQYEVKTVEHLSKNWTDIASGNLHAKMELWPNEELANIEHYVINQETCEVYPNGMYGTIGWYVPKYLQEKYPQLPQWEVLKDENFLNEIHHILYEGPPDWYAYWLYLLIHSRHQHDSDIIQELNLNLNMSHIDTEEEYIQFIKIKYEKKEPFLMNMRLPNGLIENFELLKIALPNPYQPELLQKVMWKGLTTELPQIYEFLVLLKLSMNDVKALLKEGRTNNNIEEVACNWIKNNEKVWKEWIEQSKDCPNPVFWITSTAVLFTLVIILAFVILVFTIFTFRGKNFGGEPFHKLFE